MSRNPRDAKILVIEALKSPKFKYRTVQGLARETHLSVAQVKQILESDNTVRRSLARSKSGSQLYTVKRKVSAVEDAWNAFRAINSLKFGS